MGVRRQQTHVERGSVYGKGRSLILERLRKIKNKKRTLSLKTERSSYSKRHFGQNI